MLNIRPRPTARDMKRVRALRKQYRKSHKYLKHNPDLMDIRGDKIPERQNAGVEGRIKYNRMVVTHYLRKSARIRIIWICSGVIIAIGITMTVYDSVRQKKKKQEQLDSDTEQEETKPLTSVGFAGIGAICLGVLGLCIFIILRIKLNKSLDLILYKN